ncbi:MAG: mandelate racemase/muconate lactonizing enzyme family protein [Desulfovibrionaceae bacterium]|nr:mandelate racemase/muconate lactonizing enzyme family protein [Desulfovibrionaceae bacterium]
MTDSQSAIVIKKAEIFVFRAPIDEPVRTSFGIMRDRPAVLLRLEDADGAHGWGEVWCNFPACGAEHRGRLLESVIAPLLIGQSFSSPTAAYKYLCEKTRILALQADEPGPLAQTAAAADLALWDVFSRRQNLPLYRFLGGTGGGVMPAYASGINSTGVLASIEKSRKQGYRAFKFKIGFNAEQDMRNIREAAASLKAGEGLAVDANQAWELPFALEFAAKLKETPLAWLEEPLRCDTHLSQWGILQQHCPVPLAGGENIRDAGDFHAVIHSKFLTVIQPDICKWGGLSGCLPVAKAALAAGLRYCPHYLGGGIGLMASAHLLAAVGGDGLLEIDVNANPLREALARPYPEIEDGMLRLGGEPGVGVEPAIQELESLRVMYKELS